MHAPAATGWIFRSYSQVLGDSFAWGLNDRSPWHEQVSSLMRGKLEAGLLYTVIPQPSNLQRHGEKPITMQLLVPFQFDLPDVLLLVVENQLVVPFEANAIICHRPCTAFSVFDLLGFGHWCDASHLCLVTYAHGDCSATFSDMDQLLIPTASRVYLSVKQKSRTPCVPQSAIGQASHQARRIADSITGPGGGDYQRIFKSARRILMHESRWSEETSDDSATLIEISGSRNPQVRTKSDVTHRPSLPTGPEKDDHSLMQYPVNPNSIQVADSDMGSSSTGTRHPTMSVSSASSGPPIMPLQHPSDIAWHEAWQQARRHIAEYSQAEARRQLGPNPFVHLLIRRGDDTRSIGTDCPDWLLDLRQPLHHFTRWCQQYCRTFDDRLTRAIPVCGELYQNVTTIIVVEQLPAGRVPIVVQVQTVQTNEVRFCVYEAVAIERIAGITQDVQRSIVVRNMLAGAQRLVIMHHGRRVQGREDVRFVPGSVLQVRVIPPGHPEVNSTGEPVSSLAMRIQRCLLGIYIYK